MFSSVRANIAEEFICNKFIYFVVTNGKHPRSRIETWILPNKHALKDAFPLNMTPLFKQATLVFLRLPCKKDECHHGVIRMMSFFSGNVSLKYFTFIF